MVTGKFEGILPPMRLLLRSLCKNNGANISGTTQQAHQKKYDYLLYQGMQWNTIKGLILEFCSSLHLHEAYKEYEDRRCILKVCICVGPIYIV